jgi:phosphoribosyl 1,2-cyclic phosphodiesterase
MRRLGLLALLPTLVLWAFACDGDTTPPSFFDGGSDATTSDVVQDGPGPDVVTTTHAKVIVVHASPDVPTVRVCFAIGLQNDGSDGVIAPISPLPQTGLAPGTGGALPDLGVDLSQRALTPYVILASKITSSAARCDTLAGDAGTLTQNVDYFVLPTIKNGTLAPSTTFLVAATGCVPSAIDPAADTTTCGASYDSTKGNLSLQIFTLDRVIGNTQRFGAQVAHVASPAAGVWSSLYGSTRSRHRKHAALRRAGRARRVARGGRLVVALRIDRRERRAQVLRRRRPGDHRRQRAARSARAELGRVARDADGRSDVVRRRAREPGRRSAAHVGEHPAAARLRGDDGQDDRRERVFHARHELHVRLRGRPARLGDGRRRRVQRVLAPRARVPQRSTASPVMQVHVLGTGSSGNSLLVEAEGTRLLVEAGIGPRNVVKRAQALGVELFPRGVDGIVVTHHHDDHAAQLEPLCKAIGAPRAGASHPMVHLHDGVEVHRVRHRFAVRRYRAGEAFEVGALRVRTISLAHDAPHVALAIQSKTHTLGFLTDVGSISSPVVELLASCDTVLLEANYCPQLLELGPYPRSLRRRIAGHLGHLSNQQAAALAGTLARQGTSRVFLCHLSQVNNEPELALRAVRERARDLPVDVLAHGKSRTIQLGPTPRRSFEQLKLF